jgi:hypothetical protein
MTDDPQLTPYPAEIAEAKRTPNGWVYRIGGRFSPDEAVPPEAVVGAWQVNENGEIFGDFIHNPGYKPRQPPK